MAQWIQALPGRSVGVADGRSALSGRVLGPREAIKYDPVIPALAAVAADIAARGSAVVGAELVTSSYDPTPGAVWPRPGEAPS